MPGGCKSIFFGKTLYISHTPELFGPKILFFKMGRKKIFAAKIKTGMQGEIREFLKLFGLTVFAQIVAFMGTTIIFYFYIHLIEPKEGCFHHAYSQRVYENKKNCKKNAITTSWEFLGAIA